MKENVNFFQVTLSQSLFFHFIFLRQNYSFILNLLRSVTWKFNFHSIKKTELIHLSSEGSHLVSSNFKSTVASYLCNVQSCKEKDLLPCYVFANSVNKLNWKLKVDAIRCTVQRVKQIKITSSLRSCDLDPANVFDTRLPHTWTRSCTLRVRLSRAFARHRDSAKQDRQT